MRCSIMFNHEMDFSKILAPYYCQLREVVPRPGLFLSSWRYFSKWSIICLEEVLKLTDLISSCEDCSSSSKKLSHWISLCVFCLSHGKPVILLLYVANFLFALDVDPCATFGALLYLLILEFMSFVVCKFLVNCIAWLMFLLWPNPPLSFHCLRKSL